MAMKIQIQQTTRDLLEECPVSPINSVSDGQKKIKRRGLKRRMISKSPLSIKIILKHLLLTKRIALLNAFGVLVLELFLHNAPIKKSY